MWIAALFLAAQSHYQAGLDLLAKGDAAGAAVRLEQAVRDTPGSAPAWKALGVARAAQGDIPLAQPAFDKACALDARLPDACFYHARTLYLLNRFDRALPILQSLAGSDSRAHRLIALSFEALGQWPEAEKAYKLAVARGSRAVPQEDPRIDYGAALTRQGRPSEAVALLRPFAAGHPAIARLQLELGRACLQSGELEPARLALFRALELGESSPAVHLLLGRTLVRLGRLDEAQIHLRRATLASHGSQ